MYRGSRSSGSHRVSAVLMGPPSSFHSAGVSAAEAARLPPFRERERDRRLRERDFRGDLDERPCEGACPAAAGCPPAGGAPAGGTIPRGGAMPGGAMPGGTMPGGTIPGGAMTGGAMPTGPAPGGGTLPCGGGTSCGASASADAGASDAGRPSGGAPMSQLLRDLRWPALSSCAMAAAADSPPAPPGGRIAAGNPCGSPAGAIPKEAALDCGMPTVAPGGRITRPAFCCGRPPCGGALC